MVKKISEINSFTQMGKSFHGWQKDISLIKIIQSVSEGDVTEREEEYTFKGVIQPLEAKKIALKLEGQREWQWLQIHCFSSLLDLDVNDTIVFCDQRYKVMGIYDYSLNGYVEYHVIERYFDE